MSDETIVSATTPTGADQGGEKGSVLSDSGSPVISEGESVLDNAGAEEKAQQEADNKRIMEAKDETLTAEEKAKKAELVKAKQEADAKTLAEQKMKGVPEKYDIKPPEGMELDKEALEKVAPVFKKLGFSNEQAQGISDYYATMLKEQAAKNEATLKEWREGQAKETMKALGANAKAELGYVAKVKNMLSADTIEALNASGIGNVKSFIFDMAKIGRLFSEEKLVNDKRSSAGTTNAAEILYPSMQKQ